MNLDKFTQKAQEAIISAQSLAEERNHSQIEPEHLLLALMRQSDGIAPQIVGKIGSDPAALAAAVERELETKPRVTGATSRVRLSLALDKVLKQAKKTARGMRDEYVSTEHLLLALAGGRSPLHNFLGGYGVTRDAILQTLAQVRGSQRITSISRSPREVNFTCAA